MLTFLLIMTVLSHPPLDLYEMEDKRKMNEAATAGFFPATTAVATKSASPSGRDGKGINVGVVTPGRLQSKLMAKMHWMVWRKRTSGRPVLMYDCMIDLYCNKVIRIIILQCYIPILLRVVLTSDQF